MTPIVALLYDFDKTLCTTDLEDYAFIPALGYTPAEFWRKANVFGRENRMDGLLAYMYTMIAECRAQNIRLDRDFLVRCGRSSWSCVPILRRSSRPPQGPPSPHTAAPAPWGCCSSAANKDQCKHPGALLRGV